MTRSDEARRSILASIRRSLTESAPHDVVHAQRHQPPTPGDRRKGLPVLTGGHGAPAVQPALPADPLERFRVRLEAVGGTLAVARGTEGVVVALAEMLEAAKARRAGASDSARVRPLAEQACARSGTELLIDPAPAELFDCEVGISSAQWGIVETGTLVLESSLERHRFVSLIPRVHIALLRADHLVGTLGEALRHARDGAAEGEVPSAAITLVTGPSRTSDIELTLAIGVHGPQELHVVLMEPPANELKPGSAAPHPTDQGTPS